MAEAQAGEEFLRPLWPESRGIADPDKRLYDALGVESGGPAQMFGPAAVACGIRATLKGNFIGRKHGDPWTLPSFVLVDSDQVLWRHHGRHAGDHPDWGEFLERVAT